MTETALQEPPAAVSRGYWATVGRRIVRDKVQHGLCDYPDRDFPVRCVRAMARSGRPVSGLDDPPIAPYRNSGLSARHRRTRPRHAGAADLRWEAVADHRHSSRDLGLRDRNLARPRRRLCRRLDQYRDHAHGRCVLCLPFGAAGDRDFRRVGRRHRQFHRVVDDCFCPANHPRGRKRHHQRAQHGFCRGRARLRRRSFHHHARAHARQRARADFRLCHRPHLGVDDLGRRAFLPWSRHQAAGTGMGD